VRITAFIILLFFLIPSTNTLANPYDKKTSEEIIKQAEESYKKVLRVKNAWRDTKKIIKQAKKAHKEENYEKSTNLGKKALNEAKMAYEQYEKQKDNYRFLD
tara:strand:+ start:156 stop:461 length:306 start_codon:yes stop_codon:yes gene_type:complete